MRKYRLLTLIGVALIVVAAGGYGFVRYRHDPLRDGFALLAKGDMRGAAIDLRAAVREHPGSKDAHFGLAEVDLRSGDPVAAERELRAAADLGYDQQAIRPMLAQAYIDQKKFREVLAEFPVPQGKPDIVAPILVARALAQWGMNDLAAARTSIAQVEELAPNNADAAFAAARIAIASRDTKLAEQQIDRALSINQHAPKAQLMKAQLLIGRGDRPGALEHLGAALADAPHFADALLERANLFIYMGSDAQAKADVDVVLADTPTNPVATYFDMILLVRKKDFVNANVDLQKISTVFNRFPRALFFDALVKANLGQVEQATDSAKRYVAQNPKDLSGVKLLARIYLGSRRPELAIEALNKAVAGAKPDAEILDLLGTSYQLAGRPPAALTSYSEAAELAPQNPDILARLAATKLGMGDTGGATSDLTKSLAISPNQPAVGEALVSAAFASGDVAQIRAAIDTLRAAQGDSESVGNFEGLFQIAQLNPDGARAQFQHVLAAHPDSVVARINLIKLTAMEGKQAEAMAAVTELAAKYPTNDLVLSVFVGSLLESKDVPAAIAALEKAHAAAPQDAYLIVSLVDVYIRGNDAAKALPLLDNAPAALQSGAYLLGARARALAALNRPKDAIDVYRRILSINAGNGDARSRMVALMMKTGDADSARAAINDALGRAPGNASLLVALLQVDLQAGGMARALETADQLAASPANQPAASVMKGDVYAGAHQLDLAAAAYQAELKTYPTGTLAIRLASVLSLAGKAEQGLAVMHDWVAQNPEDLAAIRAYGTLELGAKHYKEAAAHLETVIDKDPTDAVSLNNLAWIYQQLGDPRALPMAQRAYLISATPDNADTYGWLLTRQGDLAKGLGLLHLAAAKMPGNGAILYHYAVALKDSGQREQAITALNAVAAMPAAFDEKDAARALLADLSAQH